MSYTTTNAISFFFRVQIPPAPLERHDKGLRTRLAVSFLRSQRLVLKTATSPSPSPISFGTDPFNVIYLSFKSGVIFFVEMKKAPMLDLESDQSEYDLRTITSALKQYFRYVSTS